MEQRPNIMDFTFFLALSTSLSEDKKILNKS